MMKLAVFACLLAAACGSGIITPYAYSSTPFAYPATPYFGYSNIGYPDFSGNYRGPLSLAPGQPASILGADGRPLDTLDVNLDKSAHFAAKAGFHLLKKRSAALVAPIAAPIATLPSYAGAFTSPYGYNPYPGYGYAGYPGFAGYPGYGYGYSAPLAYYK